MSWVSIPNEVVNQFTGKPMQVNRLTPDLEPLYKPIPCPGIDPNKSTKCSIKFTTMRDWREHIMDEHDLDPAEVELFVRPDNEDATAASVILHMLVRLNDERQSNPLHAVRKTNDSFHATEVWRRAYLAMEKRSATIRLKQEQYEWLQRFLDRKLPLTREDREEGKGAEDRQTVAMLLYGLSEDNVRQALLSLSERRVAPHLDTPDEGPSETEEG